MRKIVFLLVLFGFSEILYGANLTWIEPDGLGAGDYALDRIGDPWEMDSDSGLELYQLDDVSFSDGVLNATASGSDPWISFELDPWDLPNTLRYKVGAVRMKRSPGGAASFNWRSQSGVWSHESFICPDNQWITVAVDFRLSTGWDGKISKFRLDPATSAGTDVSVDWVSLTEGDVADDTLTIRWLLSHDALVSFEASAAGGSSWFPLPEGTGLQLQAGPGNLTWNTSSLESSSYQLRAQVGEGEEVETANCEHLLRVNRSPDFKMTIPSEPQNIIEGRDHASLSGNAWDMVIRPT